MDAAIYRGPLTISDRLIPRLNGMVAASNFRWPVASGSGAKAVVRNGLFRRGPGRGERLKLCALRHIASLRPSGMLPLNGVDGFKGRFKLATVWFWFSRFFGVAFSMPRLRHITVG